MGTVVLMSDTRAPIPQHGEPLSYVHMAFYVNARFASRHGYRLLYLQLRETGCSHPLFGRRHPSYCKLAALGEALGRGYEMMLWLDSDAVVQHHHLSLPAIIDRRTAHGHFELLTRGPALPPDLPLPCAGTGARDRQPTR